MKANISNISIQINKRENEPKEEKAALEDRKIIEDEIKMKEKEISERAEEENF